MPDQERNTARHWELNYNPDPMEARLVYSSNIRVAGDLNRL